LLWARLWNGICRKIPHIYPQFPIRDVVINSFSKTFWVTYLLE
jgi:hypothetical protein